MSLRVIEFDKKQFKTPEECLTWLSASPYEYIIHQKGFQLRPRKVCQYLSWEKRPVFHFSNKLWHESKLEILRPSRGICVVVSISENKLYYDDHLPEQLEETKQKLEKKRKKQEETKLKQLQDKETRKRKREEEKEKRKLENPKKSARKKILFDTENVLTVDTSEAQPDPIVVIQTDEAVP